MKSLLYKISLGFSPLKFALVINITNVCNRFCNFCPYHGKIKDNYHTRWVKLQPKMIKLESLQRFFGRKFIRILIKNVAITGKGEPFLHPHIKEICDLLERYQISFTITTNGYDMPQVLKFIKEYEHLKQIRVSIYDDIQIYNRDKLTYFNMTGKSIEGTTEGYVAAQYGIEHPRAIKNFNKVTFCKAPFSFLTMNTDGSITPCYSYDETSSIEKSTWDIWNGSKIRKYRRKAANGRKLKYADCDNCGINY